MIETQFRSDPAGHFRNTKSCAVLRYVTEWIYGETRRGDRGPQLLKLLNINGDSRQNIGTASVRRTDHDNPSEDQLKRFRIVTTRHGLMTPLGMVSAA
jgi:hypothetical protein